MSLDIILQAAVGGLLLGGVYMLLAAGLTLIFGVMRVINFAQADFMMLGMFTTYLVATTTGIDPLLLAVPVGMALAALGMGFARYFLERVPRGDHNAQLILTLGVSLVLQHLVLIVFDPTPRVVVRPYTNAYWTPFGLFINEARLFACLASLVIMGALYLFLTRSWTGRAMRATADDPVSAEGVGINVRQISHRRLHGRNRPCGHCRRADGDLSGRKPNHWQRLHCDHVLGDRFGRTG